MQWQPKCHQKSDFLFTEYHVLLYFLKQPGDFPLKYSLQSKKMVVTKSIRRCFKCFLIDFLIVRFFFSPLLLTNTSCDCTW